MLVGSVYYCWLAVCNCWLTVCVVVGWPSVIFVGWPCVLLLVGRMNLFVGRVKLLLVDRVNCCWLAVRIVVGWMCIIVFVWPCVLLFFVLV